MNLLALSIATLPLLSGPVPVGEVSLELRSAKPELLVAEPYDLSITLVNHGSESVSVARTFYSYAILLVTEDGQVECESGNPGVKGAAEVKWEAIEPRAELPLSLPAFQCLCRGDQSTGCQDWLYRPGRYKLKVVFAHRPSDTGVASSPAGALDATLESNLVEIRVKEPTGVDADALAWAKSINEHPLSVKVINRFPSSTYSALVIYGKINLEGTDPATVKNLMDRGEFPSWNSVPDPASPDGWSSLHGSEFGRWQVQQAERILRDHPDFPYAGRLRLVVGVNNLCLGMKEQGLNVLRDLAKHADKAEGAWAKTFLSLVQ